MHIEQILIYKIIDIESKCSQPSLILMSKSTFKKLIKSINKTYNIRCFKDFKKNQKWFMGIKIYITKDLNKGEIIVM